MSSSVSFSHRQMKMVSFSFILLFSVTSARSNDDLRMRGCWNLTLKLSIPLYSEVILTAL